MQTVVITASKGLIEQLFDATLRHECVCEDERAIVGEGKAEFLQQLIDEFIQGRGDVSRTEVELFKDTIYMLQDIRKDYQIINKSKVTFSQNDCNEY